MKVCIPVTVMFQVGNAIIASLCHKPMIAFVFSVPVSVAMAWIIEGSLVTRRIITRHHGVIHRNERPILYWLIVGLKIALWGMSLYFPWGTTMRG